MVPGHYMSVCFTVLSICLFSTSVRLLTLLEHLLQLTAVVLTDDVISPACELPFDKNSRDLHKQINRNILSNRELAADLWLSGLKKLEWGGGGRRIPLPTF